MNKQNSDYLYLLEEENADQIQSLIRRLWKELEEEYLGLPFGIQIQMTMEERVRQAVFNFLESKTSKAADVKVSFRDNGIAEVSIMMPYPVNVGMSYDE